MTVTQEYINELLDTAEVKEIVVFEKCLICAYKFTNGFVIVESSACVDPKNFDIDIGRKICREHVENRLWEGLEKGGEVFKLRQKRFGMRHGSS